MRRAALLALALGVVGCGGGTPPALSDLVLSTPRALLGTEVFLRAHLFDPDGDLDGGTLHTRVEDLEAHLELELEGESPILGFELGRTAGEVIVGTRLVGAVGLGRYRLELVAEDARGERSEPVSAPVTLVGPGQ